MAENFKKIFVEVLDKHCNSGLYCLKYPLVNRMIEDIRRFGPLPFQDSIPYEFVYFKIKQAYKCVSRRSLTVMMKATDVMDKIYEGALSYGKKLDDSKFGRNYEGPERIERQWRYVVRDGCIVTTDEMGRAADVDMRSISTAGFASELGKMFKIRNVNTLVPVR